MVPNSSNDSATIGWHWYHSVSLALLLGTRYCDNHVVVSCSPPVKGREHSLVGHCPMPYSWMFVGFVYVPNFASQIAYIVSACNMRWHHYSTTCYGNRMGCWYERRSTKGQLATFWMWHRRQACRKTTSLPLVQFQPGEWFFLKLLEKEISEISFNVIWSRIYRYVIIRPSMNFSKL